ncbi:MAG: ATP-binding protein [Pseudomonadota bacterium]
MSAVSVSQNSDQQRLSGALAALIERYEGAEDGWQDAAERIGRDMVQAGFPLVDVVACCDRASQRAAGPQAKAIQTQILDIYQRSFQGYQTVQAKLTKEVHERRRIEETLKEVNFELNEQRKLLSSEVQAQTRALRDRYAEAQALSDSIAHQRDELSEMIFAISHDLKGPLNTIGMLIEAFLEDNHEMPADFEDLHFATGTVKRSKKLLDDLMYFSRTLDEEKVRTEIDLNALIPEIIQDLVGKNDEKIATFEVGPLPIISGSEFQIRHLFQNLISNAIKFRHPDRHPVIRIEDLNPLALRRCGIRVADNGIGIDKIHHEKIFGLFSRLHSYEAIPGSGLGLSLCRRVAKTHGGEIRVTSELGQGASFDVVLSQ